MVEQRRSPPHSSQEVEEERLGLHHTLQKHTSGDLLPPIRPRLLQLPPASNSPFN
jgi:hypothetical protein